MKNKLISVILFLLIGAGIVLIFIDPIQTKLVEKTSSDLIVEQYTSEEIIVHQDTEVSYDFEEVQSLSIWDILKAQATAKDIPVIGSIHIPNIELTLPIIKGVGKSALAVGAGTMKPKQMMGEGNYALASHYIEGKDVLFGPLYDLEVGDSIYLSDLDYVYEYLTTEIKVIEATDVYIIDDVPEQQLLTLITCAEKGTKRLSVRAELVSKTEATEIQTLS